MSADNLANDRREEINLNDIDPDNIDTLLDEIEAHEKKEEERRAIQVLALNTVNTSEDKEDEQTDPLSDWIRTIWKAGSECEIYSNSDKEWFQGTIKRVFTKEEDEWVEVEYVNENKTIRCKQAARDDITSIRPLTKALSIYEYVYNAAIKKKQNQTENNQLKTIDILNTPKPQHSAKIPVTMVQFESITFLCDEQTINNERCCNTDMPWLSFAAPKLKELGYQIEKIIWNDKNIKWEDKNNIIIGPIWNYASHIEQFEKWVNKINVLQQQNKINIYNDINFIKWNYDKKYLFDLQNIGNILVTQTIIIDDTKWTLESNEKEKTQVISEVFNTLMSENKGVVIKGVVDCAGQTMKVFKNKDTFNEESVFKHIEYLQLNNHGAMIQPFYSEFIETGEFNFCFYNDLLSHCGMSISAKHSNSTNIASGITKYFYINTKYSKDIVYATDIAFNIATFRDDIDPNLIASNIVNATEQINNIYENILNVLKIKKILPNDKTLLYLRIDGIMVNTKFMITEVEGIEPYMGFLWTPDYIIDNYVQAIHQKLNSN
eukprot:199121_1